VSNSSYTVLTFVLPIFNVPAEFANFTDPTLLFPFNNASSEKQEHHTVSAAAVFDFRKKGVVSFFIFFIFLSLLFATIIW